MSIPTASTSSSSTFLTQPFRRRRSSHSSLFEPSDSSIEEDDTSIIQDFRQALDTLEEVDSTGFIKYLDENVTSSLKQIDTLTTDTIKYVDEHVASTFDSVREEWHHTKHEVEEVWDMAKETVGESWSAAKETVGGKWDAAKESIGEKWDVAKIGAKRLLSLEELPVELRENEYILTGYRFLSSKRACLKSIFSLHNETCNIWTHLLPIPIIAYLFGKTFLSEFSSTAPLPDKIIFGIFFIASLKCLICSSVYHTFLGHSSRKTACFAATLDYIGISLLITASVLTFSYYGFYFEPSSQATYMTITTILGLAGTIFPFFKFWDTRQYRSFRIAVFVGMAFSAIIPVLHLGLIRGWLKTLLFAGPLWWSVGMYITGVIIYGMRFPEKFFPGRFDFAGMHSHAIWHIFVFLGIYFHYTAILHFYKSHQWFGCSKIGE